MIVISMLLLFVPFGEVCYEKPWLYTFAVYFHIYGKAYVGNHQYDFSLLPHLKFLIKLDKVELPEGLLST